MTQIPSTHEFIMASKEAHSKYRDSAIALMTTIIGLSTGAIYASSSCPLIRVPVLFVFPISFAILQEFFDVMGKLYSARDEQQTAMGSIYSEWYQIEKKDEYKTNCISAINEREKAFKKSTEWFTWADRFIKYTVVAFLSVGIICLVGVKLCVCNLKYFYQP
jgi:hypothetical protein